MKQLHMLRQNAALRRAIFQNSSRTHSPQNPLLQLLARPLHSSRTITNTAHNRNSISLFRNFRTVLLRRIRQIRHNSSNPSPRPQPDPTPHLGSPEPKLSLGQRMKKLSREYGWSALGVYLGLSALDFPFCFLAVRLLGTDRIGRWEHAIVTTVKEGVDYVFPSLFEQTQVVAVMAEGGEGVANPGSATAEDWSWGVEEAEQANKNDATIWTQLALAYAVHKSFIFIRVPLTAAVTPKVVKVLRGWGWDIGKRKPKNN